MALSESENLAHAQRAVPCNVCENEVPGEYYCIECKQTLCLQCEKNHKRIAGTRNHNIVQRTQVGDINTTTLTCTDHEDQASCHCEKCNIPLCTKCVTGKHKGHTMSDLGDVLEEEKRKFQRDIKAMQEAVLTMKNQRGELITEKEIYKKKIKKILNDMEDENQAVMTEIMKIRNERKFGILSIQDSQIELFAGFEEEMKRNIILYEKRISEYEDTIKKNNLLDFRNIAKERKSSLPEIGSKPELAEPPMFVPGVLQLIVENLGQLQTSSMSKPTNHTTPTLVSRFACPLPGNPKICISKEGDVWLGGHKSRELVKVDIKGQVLRRREIQNEPNGLAMMECGDVIISPRSCDSRSVSRLLEDDREHHLFDTSPSYSAGVSVTIEQEILTCTVDGRVVRINGDGTNVQQIYKGSGEWSALHAVESTDRSIYISDPSHSAIVMSSKYGKVLSTITHTTDVQQFGRPWGMVVDKMYNILCADFDNNCVYTTHQNEQMRELVGRSHGIQSPTWLAVDNDNNLWITQKNGIINVVKYLSS